MVMRGRVPTPNERQLMLRTRLYWLLGLMCLTASTHWEQLLGEALCGDVPKFLGVLNMTTLFRRVVLDWSVDMILIFFYSNQFSMHVELVVVNKH